MELHHADAGHAIATVDGVVIRVITTAPTYAAELDQLRIHLDDVLADAQWAGLWVVVHHGAPVPDLATRRHAGKVFKPYGDRIALVYTMLGLGFWAKLALAASRSITALTNNPAPIETEVSDGAERLARELVGLDPALLVEAYTQLLAHINAAAPPLRGAK